MALRSFGNGALFAEVLGEGVPRILALHGWGRRGADFRPSLDGLPALAPDLPGFGATPPPGEVIGADGYAAIVAEMLDEFDGPAVLVGHSFGGRVAMCVASRHPQAVSGMVLTGVPVLRLTRPARPSWGYRAIRLLNHLGALSDTRLETERRKRGSADYRAATGVMRDVLVKVIAESYEEALEEVAAPITFLWGAGDSEVPVAVAERAIGIRLAAGRPASLRVVEGVGHLLPTEAPAQLRSVVEAMIR